MNCNVDGRFAGVGLRGPRGVHLCALTAVFLVAVVLGLSLFVYSPLHEDDPISSAPCPFCQFQHLSAEPAVTVLHVAISTLVFWFLIVAEPRVRWTSLTCARFGRAPPLSL